MLRIDLSRIRLAFMGALFTAVLIYLTLLCGEFALAYITRPAGAELDRLKSLRERIEQQDFPERKAALRDGFKPVISPGNIEASSRLRSLALKYNVAPLAPQPHSKLYLCNEGYGLVRYTSDRFGFRNPDDAWRNSVDVILIGDSYVHGACVEDADTIAAHLRSRFKVLNLGTIGNNPVTYAALVKTFLPKVKPHAAALIFYANDFDSGSNFSFSYSANFVRDTEYFKYEGNELELSDGMVSFYRDAEKIVMSQVMSDLDGSALKRKFSPTVDYLSGKRFELRLVREHLIDLFRKLAPDASMPFSTKLAIDTVAGACQRYHCTPIIAFIPASEKWHPNSESKLYSKLLAEYAASKKLQFFDAAEALSTLGESAYAKQGAHLSPEGYKLFADELARRLEGD
jgi:hypothetical protein